LFLKNSPKVPANFIRRLCPLQIKSRFFAFFKKRKENSIFLSKRTERKMGASDESIIIFVAVIVVIAAVLFSACFFCFGPREQVRGTIRCCKRVCGGKSAEDITDRLANNSDSKF
jgi:hypothetical protein